jgi:hypothetical protein
LRTLVVAAAVLAVHQTGIAQPPTPTLPTVRADEAASNPSVSESVRLFNDRVLPVLEEHCFACHSARAEPLQGGLRLDSPVGLRAGGESGPVVIAGDAQASRLVSALRHEDLEMPPDQDRLPDAVIDDIVRWIELGAADPRPETASLESSTRRQSLEEAKDYWAYRPLMETPLPEVRDTQWPTNWIDRFVLAKLEAQGLKPAPPASPQVWVRRVYYTLAGLPPEPDIVQEFSANPTRRAAERIVDRLLASPAYGEHAAQQWLDLIRFSESEGFEYDNPIPDAWRFRDYAIKSFGTDVPFDQFLQEQIAGDEMHPDKVHYLTASVFHRLGAVRRNAGNQLVAASRNEVLTERTDIIGAVFLGLSIGCARCHDHKFEAISQRDYYGLQAFLAATDEVDIALDSSGQIAEDQSVVARTAELERKLRELRRELNLARGPAKAELEQAIAELELRLAQPRSVVPAVKNLAQSRTPIHILARGEWDRKRDPVGPRGMAVLSEAEPVEWPAEMDQPRTRLAHWLLNDAESLVGRVYANRIWQACFGLGLVATPSNFGVSGQPPSHPELLDNLALELIRGGWQRKLLLRTLVLSSTFAQASNPEGGARPTAADPDNRWLGRFARRRLTAEELRDSMLSIAGQLNDQRGGKSVMVPVEQGLVDLLYKPAQWSVSPDVAQHHRRSIYLLAKRNLRLPFLEVFDQPAGQTSCPQRQSTTHASQSLELLNGDFANDMAVALAARLERECGEDRSRQVQRAFWLATGRAASEREMSLCLDFLAEHSLREFALVILNLNGLLYVD